MSVPPDQVASQISDTSQLGGTFQMPDTSALDTQIASDRKAAEGYEAKGVATAEKAADLQEQAAAQVPQQMAQLDALLQQYPTRDVAYGAAMHNAPILATLTALGGKLTRLNGMEMLGATNGIMQGLNQGAENHFQDSLAKWNAAYTRQKQLFDEQQRAQQLMLSAYQGRADAYQKAAEAARRMTGDELSQKQDSLKNQIDLFKVQQTQMAQLERAKEAWARIATERERATAQERRWNALGKTVTDPRTKAILAANQHEWQNLKAQLDAVERQRGQVSSELELSGPEKATALSNLDSRALDLQQRMDDIMSRGESLALSVPGQPAAESSGAPASGAGGTPSPTTSAGPSKYQSPEEVRQAVSSGQLPYLSGVQILKNDFGMQ